MLLGTAVQKSNRPSRSSRIPNGVRYWVGDLEILGRVGRGGMANVWLARRQGEANLLCLKTIRPDIEQRREYVLMLLDEARTAARLEHPNCLRTYAPVEIDDAPCITMEYVLGETLDQLLKQAIEEDRPLPKGFVLSVAAGVLDALAYAHSLSGEDGRPLGLVHRDVSPQNVLISAEGVPKLFDFGVAKSRDRYQVTGAGVLKGKFRYMSPEQIASEPLDHRSDVYAVGLLLYSCLSNTRPFEKMTLEELFIEKVTKGLPSLATVSPGIEARLVQVVDKSILREREDRFQSAAEMRAALQPWLPRDMKSAISSVLHARTRVQSKREAIATLSAIDMVTDSILSALELDRPDPAEFEGMRQSDDPDFADATEVDMEHMEHMELSPPERSDQFFEPATPHSFLGLDRRDHRRRRRDRG